MNVASGTMTLNNFTGKGKLRGKSVEKFISAANAAKRFNVTARTVVRWINDGDLPGAVRVTPGIKNSPFFIPLSSIEEFEKKFPERIRPASDINGDGVGETT